MTPRQGGAAASVEDVEARAARLGITPERVLREYARIAFSDISRILAWDAEGRLKAKIAGDVEEDDRAAIAEIVAGASSGKIYRIKLHDKKPVLDALARYLGLRSEHNGKQNGEDEEAAPDPVDHLIAALDQVAGEAGAGPGDPVGTDPQ